MFLSNIFGSSPLGFLSIYGRCKTIYGIKYLTEFKKIFKFSSRHAPALTETQILKVFEVLYYAYPTEKYYKMDMSSMTMSMTMDMSSTTTTASASSPTTTAAMSMDMGGESACKISVMLLIP